MDELIAAVSLSNASLLDETLSTYPHLINEMFEEDEVTSYTLLGKAILKRNINVVRVLLKHNADPNMEWSHGTPLSVAVSNIIYADILYDLLDMPTIDVHKYSYFGETPLHTACRHNNIVAVDALLKHANIDVNYPDDSGTTPIYLTVKNIDLFTMLYKKGANINVVNDNKQMPIDGLFDNIEDEVDKTNSVKPIYELIVNTNREPINVSAQTLANILKHEHIEPSMFNIVIGTATNIDFDSNGIYEQVNSFFIAVNASLIEQLKTMIAITNYNINSDSNIAFYIFSSLRPTKSLHMLKYLVEEQQLDVNVLDSQGFPVIYAAINNRCIDCAQYLLDHKIGIYNIDDKTISIRLAFSSLFTNINIVNLGLQNNVFNYIDKTEFIQNQPEMTAMEALFHSIHRNAIDFVFIKQVIASIVKWQGFPFLTNIPDWVLRTSIYDTYRKYDTLQYRSLRFVPDKDHDAVQRFRQFRQYE
ncbi:putative ankyrin repeat protein [Scale drop disease virus]|nr:putative ankyrin repeat protein [Scale drop disease virus]